jgi:hypothetical protein
VALRFARQEDGTWKAELVIDVPAKKVDGWVLPEMNGNRQLTFSLQGNRTPIPWSFSP